MNISHDMDPMRDMILKIREINIQGRADDTSGQGMSPAAWGVVKSCTLLRDSESEQQREGAPVISNVDIYLVRYLGTENKLYHSSFME